MAKIIGALIDSGSANRLFTVARVNPLRVYVSVPENFGKEIQLKPTLASTSSPDVTFLLL